MQKGAGGAGTGVFRKEKEREEVPMKTVDARGKACPQPLILAKKALNGLAAGDLAQLLVDNETSKQNVERFCKDNGVEVQTVLNGGVFTIAMKKLNKEAIAADEKAYCAPESMKKPHVVVFRSDTMGSGPAELGQILMKAFVNTIKEIKPLPGHLVFYNTGINLVVDGSALLGPLSGLETMGVKILVCGTCLDYFNLKSKLKVGEISNMFTILETVTNAGLVVTP
jgi:selenium metabolism protein YedF